MMCGAMVFSPVVCQIGLTRLPKEAELVLVDIAVMEEMELHVHGCCSSRLNVTVDDSFGSAVVGLDGCRGLRMSQFLQHVG